MTDQCVGRGGSLSRVGVLLLAFSSVLGCRRDPTATQPVTTDEEGNTAGTGWTAQCSGWFPDWIAETQPPSPSFQLSQGYPLGVPIFTDVDGVSQVTGWDPPSPASGAAAPWLAYDFHIEAERLDYLQALKNYALEGMIEADFVAQKNNKRRWYHVPLMTTGNNPREGRRGLTAERTLQSEEQSWLKADARAFGTGYYNSLGGYTIGQVFDDPEPSNSKPQKAQFIAGTFVFKILFAEYNAANINGSDPLAHAPEWTIQDLASPAGAGTVVVRLLQMDIAVKDPRSTTTGWVFAEFVYDESLPAATAANRWRNLAPVGLQWGNDNDVTGPGVGTLNETWVVDAALVPDQFEGHLGRHGRLNGPVDNPQSACMSCHSTAQAYVPAANTTAGAFKSVGFLPQNQCLDSQDMHWFRSIPGNQPFDRMIDDPAIPGGDFCKPQVPAPSGLHPLDYSLQIQLGLALGMGENHPNPCADLVPADEGPGAVERALNKSLKGSDDKARSQMRSQGAARTSKAEPRRAQIKAPELKRLLTPPQGADMR